MKQAKLAFTAVFLKVKNGYVGFVEELPSVNSYGTTLDETRQLLHKLVRLAFDEERRASRELTAGREVLRESLLVPLVSA